MFLCPLKILISNVVSWATVLITFGLPVLLYVFAVSCNDLTGCPALPSVHPKPSFWGTLRVGTGWPDGVWDFFSFRVLIAVLAYYLLSMVLWRMLPAQELYGTKLVHHGRPLKYRLNGK